MHRHHSFLYTKVQRDLSEVPTGVKTVIFGLFVYFIAWGIIDPFLSIFINNFTRNYALTGLLYGLFFLIGALVAVPLGDLAGKINKIKYSVVSMLAYPLIGLVYLSVALLHGRFSILLLFVARVAHGIAALFWVMTDDFIREHSPKHLTSATFGLQITFQKLAYVIAPVFIILAALLFGITTQNLHWLLLALFFFPVIGALIISRVRDKGKPVAEGIEEVVVEDGVFKKELQDLHALGFVGYFSLLMGFFMCSIQAVVYFLVPLYALSLNLGLVEISLLFALINLPYLFSFFLAELADSFGKTNVIAAGFVLAGIVLFWISTITAISTMFFVACFALGAIMAMLQPAVNGLITDITPRVQDGEMTGLLSAVVKVSAFVSAVTLGLMASAFGLQFPFLAFALPLFVMAALTYSIKRKVVVRI